MRSKALLTSWDLTKLRSIFLGLLTASKTDFLVISLNTILFSKLRSKFKTSAKCQAIASPSRSGSVAIKTVLFYHCTCKYGCIF